MTSPLDNPIWAALTGPQAALADRNGAAARYLTDISLFAGIGGPDGWADLAALAGPRGEVYLTGAYLDVPDGWQTTFRMPGVQLTGERVAGEPFPGAEILGPADVPEMLDLVERTKPGPFRKRTVELGRYLGVRRDGKLAAMAGTRMRLPDGWTEISAICTDPAFRGQGLAAGLTLALAHDIQSRGERPFLATLASNANAIRLYERLGFEHRREVEFTAFLAPAHM
ncbi:GNAT family N-acetyltransferase [Actinoplanes sp. NPDC051633]|uniref:GNAT family N-acetyltransferase n=1 Tax=Actinoplanes sp. NPDC051633 TaxID=3155670 RepID=UPI00342FEE02